MGFVVPPNPRELNAMRNQMVVPPNPRELNAMRNQMLHAIYRGQTRDTENLRVQEVIEEPSSKKRDGSFREASLGPPWLRMEE